MSCFGGDRGAELSVREARIAGSLAFAALMIFTDLVWHPVLPEVLVERSTFE